METKTCTKCGETKPLSEFYKNKNYKRGYTAQCKECSRAYYHEHRNERLAANAEYREANRKELAAASRKYYSEHRKDCKERSWSRALRTLYGFTLGNYDEMLEAQGNSCAICGRTPEENGRRLAVDHDHETGEVRGLLCNSCNRGVGNLQDDPELCRRAMLYLRDFGE